MKSFKDPAGIKILVATMATLGIGLTLFDPKQGETAHRILIADLPFRYADLKQSICRLHRLGQKHVVYVEVLIYDGEKTARFTFSKKLFYNFPRHASAQAPTHSITCDNDDQLPSAGKPLARILRNYQGILIVNRAFLNRAEKTHDGHVWKLLMQKKNISLQAIDGVMGEKGRKVATQEIRNQKTIQDSSAKSRLETSQTEHKSQAGTSQESEKTAL